jgi:hypothetical protein
LTHLGIKKIDPAGSDFHVETARFQCQFANMEKHWRHLCPPDTREQLKV